MSQKNRTMAVKHAKARKYAIQARKFRDYDMMSLDGNFKPNVRPSKSQLSEIRYNRNMAIQDRNWFDVIKLNWKL